MNDRSLTVFATKERVERIFFSSLKFDIPSSIAAFLVALPLCMGIAIASGVPVAAGLITGIVGGIVVGALAGAPLQVSGPAAGLTVVVYEIVRDSWRGGARRYRAGGGRAANCGGHVQAWAVVSRGVAGCDSRHVGGYRRFDLCQPVPRDGG